MIPTLRGAACTPTGTYLPVEMMDQLRALAKARRLSVAAVLRRLVQDEIKFAFESGELLDSNLKEMT